MNTTTYNRAEKTAENSTEIPTSLLTGDKITATQLGLIFLLVKQGDMKGFRKIDMRKKSGLGDRLFDRAWNGLVDLGYITEENNHPHYNYIINI